MHKKSLNVYDSRVSVPRAGKSHYDSIQRAGDSQKMNDSQKLMPSQMELIDTKFYNLQKNYTENITRLS